MNIKIQPDSIFDSPNVSFRKGNLPRPFYNEECRREKIRRSYTKALIFVWLPTLVMFVLTVSAIFGWHSLTLKIPFFPVTSGLAIGLWVVVAYNLVNKMSYYRKHIRAYLYLVETTDFDRDNPDRLIARLGDKAHRLLQRLAYSRLMLIRALESTDSCDSSDHFVENTNWEISELEAVIKKAHRAACDVLRLPDIYLKVDFYFEGAEEAELIQQEGI